MLAAVSGKVENIIIFVLEYALMYICFIVHLFQYMFSRFTGFLQKTCYFV